MFKMYKTWHLQVYIYLNRSMVTQTRGKEAVHVITWILHSLPLSYFNPGNFSDPINHTVPWTASLVQLKKWQEGGDKNKAGAWVGQHYQDMKIHNLNWYRDKINCWNDFFLCLSSVSRMQIKSWTKLTQIQAAPSALSLVSSHPQRKGEFEHTSSCQNQVS